MSNLKIIYSQDIIKNPGELKFDKDGYAWLRVGGYNVMNSAGQKYVITDKVRALYAENSALQNRIKNGQQFGEHGHPKLVPGMSIKEFSKRLSIVDENNISTHHRKVETF